MFDTTLLTMYNNDVDFVFYSLCKSSNTNNASDLPQDMKLTLGSFLPTNSTLDFTDIEVIVPVHQQSQ